MADALKGLLNTVGPIASAIFPAAAPFVMGGDALLNAVDPNNPSGSSGGGASSGSSATSGISPAVLAQAMQQAQQKFIQQQTNSALSIQQGQTDKAISNMQNWQSQYQNPALSGQFSTALLGKPGQVNTPSGGAYSTAAATPSASASGTAPAAASPNYANILAMLAGKSGGGSPSPSNMAAAAPNTVNGAPAPSLAASAQAFQQQFGMTPDQWFAQNPNYYQPGNPVWNSPQMQFLNSSGYLDARTAQIKNGAQSPSTPPTTSAANPALLAGIPSPTPTPTPATTPATATRLPFLGPQQVAA